MFLPAKSMERRQSTRWRHSPPSPPTPHPKQYWFLTPILRSAHLKKKKSLWEKALQSPRRTELPNPETTFQWLSPGTWDNHLLERRCPGPLLPAVEGGEAVFPVTGPPPGAAGERRGTRISTPTAPGAQTESRGPRLRRDAPFVIPPLGGPARWARLHRGRDASRRTAHRRPTSPAARARETEVSLPLAAAAAHGPPGSRAPGRGRVGGRRDRSRSRDLLPRAGNQKKKKKAEWGPAGRDRPRLPKGERGRGGEPLPRPPGSAPPGGEGSPGPARPAGRRGFPRGSLGASSAPAPRRLGAARPAARFPGWGAAWGSGTAAAGPRRRERGSRGRAATPPHPPRGHGAGTCRRGGSPVLSLCLSRAPPAPQPAQQAASAPDAAAGDWQRPRSGQSPPGQRPAQSRPRGPQDPPPIGPRGCQSAPKDARAVAPPIPIGGRTPSMQIRPRPRPFAPPPWCNLRLPHASPRVWPLPLCGRCREEREETERRPLTPSLTSGETNAQAS